MNIGIIGTGRMGGTLERIAVEQGHGVIARFWDARPLRPDAECRGVLSGADVLIDFSSAEAVPGNIRIASELGLPMVEGTTGWSGFLKDAEAEVRRSGIGFVHAANFSLGVNLFYRVAERAGELFSAFSQYDSFIEETHHQFKKDAPSGTALELRRLLSRSRPDRDIPVTSVRAGYSPGRHAVSFDSAVDTVTLVHTARGREGLAAGALLAAEWIRGRTGFYHFSEVLEQILSERTT
ncbi:dihydrodipicolinate reductase [bacterium]|nr:dihydrodipicolinate reductase [bacterium]